MSTKNPDAINFNGMSIKERFHTSRGNGITYAALSHGSPAFIHGNIDRSVFQKTDKEKAELLKLKSGLPKTRGYKFKTLAKFAV